MQSRELFIELSGLFFYIQMWYNTMVAILMDDGGIIDRKGANLRKP